jgi:hypothetical protein
MKRIKYSRITDPSINVDNLIKQIRSGTIKLSEAIKLADEGKLSGNDFAKVLVSLETGHEKYLTKVMNKVAEYELSQLKNHPPES